MVAKLDGDDDDIIADINITALVDVVLVLLIIFMVTATYIMAPSIKVKLPKAATGESTQSSTLAVVLDREGQLFLNGEPATEKQLAVAVRREKTAHPEIQAIISADKEVSHGAVIRIIDLVKLNGVSRFAINIDPAVVRAAGQGKPVPIAPENPAPQSPGGP